MRRVALAEDDWEYQVRHRAYELWNEAGRPDGKHQQFWEVAERELKGARAVSGPETPDGEILDARPFDSPGSKP